VDLTFQYLPLIMPYMLRIFLQIFIVMNFYKSVLDRSKVSDVSLDGFNNNDDADSLTKVKDKLAQDDTSDQELQK